MSFKFATRREFLNFSKLSLVFLLNSCSNLPNKVKIALQNSLYPQSFKDTIPKEWKQEKINFRSIQLKKNRNTITKDIKIDLRYKICFVDIIKAAKIQNCVKKIIGIIKSGVTAKNLIKPGA